MSPPPLVAARPAALLPPALPRRPAPGHPGHRSGGMRARAVPTAPPWVPHPLGCVRPGASRRPAPPRSRAPAFAREGKRRRTDPDGYCIPRPAEPALTPGGEGGPAVIREAPLGNIARPAKSALTPGGKGGPAIIRAAPLGCGAPAARRTLRRGRGCGLEAPCGHAGRAADPSVCGRAGRVHRGRVAAPCRGSGRAGPKHGSGAGRQPSPALRGGLPGELREQADQDVAVARQIGGAVAQQLDAAQGSEVGQERPVAADVRLVLREGDGAAEGVHLERVRPRGPVEARPAPADVLLAGVGLEAARHLAAGRGGAG